MNEPYARGAQKQVAIYLPNHLGDCLMALPAMLKLRDQDLQFVLVGKSFVLDFLRQLGFASEQVILEKGASGLFKNARELKLFKCEEGAILAESFRSALLFRMSGIAKIRGKNVDLRWPLLSQRVNCKQFSAGHRSLEYGHILGLSNKNFYASIDDLVADFSSVASLLALPDETQCSAEKAHEPEIMRVGFFPGAARGPSKMWPLSHFFHLAQLIEEHFPMCRFEIFGGASEIRVCEELRDLIGTKAESFGGKTAPLELIKRLKSCHVVVSNDSGGAHLAGFLGVLTVVIFGLTDPKRTRPIGSKVRVVSAPHGFQSEKIARDSVWARRALESIAPETVYQTLVTGLIEFGRHGL